MVPICGAVQIFESGQISAEILSGYLLTVAGACLKNFCIICLLRALLSTFFLPATCRTKTLLSYLRLFKVRSHISFMHCLQLEVSLCTMNTTDILSQKTITLVLVISSAQVKIPAHSANSSRNSMLGSQC